MAASRNGPKLWMRAWPPADWRWMLAWISHDYQAGQPGKTVRPELYVACGISGAVQHTAGMKESKCVAAINRNPDAESCQFADSGIVGDIRVIVPATIEGIQRLQSLSSQLCHSHRKTGVRKTKLGPRRSSRVRPG